MKLNIGAGATVIEGFTPIDRKQGGEAFPLRLNDGSPVADNSVDEIRASHVLEHFRFGEVNKVIDEWARVLKPGGKIRIAVPDFDKIAELKKTDPQWYWYAMGGQTDDDDYHRSTFDEGLLRGVMDGNFTNIQRWHSPNADTASHPCSLNLEGVKVERVQPTTQEIKICAVTSIPRIGWNDHWGCLVDGLAPFRIPIRRAMGAFWGQGIQNILEGCVADGLDWALCLDYDTLFNAQHLSDLIQVLGENPHIDAVAAMQCRRGKDFPLMTVGGATQVELTGAPVKVATAHFGFTIIRLECLKDIPKPWFVSKPGPDGTWTHDDHLDDDIWFWHQWRLANRSIYVAPNVRVGHLELMVSEFDELGQAQRIHVTDWLQTRMGKKVTRNK